MILMFFLLLGINLEASFWAVPRKGANIFNQKIKREDIKAAKAYGIKFVRIAPDKFISAKREFLIGNADGYEGLVQKDLVELKKVLDMCAEERMPVVLTMLALPGYRWRQKNGNKPDLRLWLDDKFQQQAVKFWQDLAIQLKGHPAIVGYNLLNEPYLGAIDSLLDASTILFKFYSKTISAIRAVDNNIPIILDSSNYGDARAFCKMKAQADNNVLYSFHVYEPYKYTTRQINGGKYRYPGPVGCEHWDKRALQVYMQNVITFQKANKIPSSRILVGEFGANRFSNGIEQYFADLVCIFKQYGWHFAFYSFREDCWSGMDYELGRQKLPWNYRQVVKQRHDPVLSLTQAPEMFKILLLA